VKPRRLPEWSRPPVNPGIPEDTFELIIRRRRQMLVHSYIYYYLDDNVVTDHRWMSWAQELDRLQREHGKVFAFYDWAFRDWDGSSGFQLPSTDPDIHRVAERLLAQAQEKPQ
jgi:hypothetical protein